MAVSYSGGKELSIYHPNHLLEIALFSETRKNFYSVISGNYGISSKKIGSVEMNYPKYEISININSSFSGFFGFS